ncbi:MAG: oleate hydratase [Alphaproteobacteria bacterium GM202ARS2]|nr:oleate hydratase [Alphaproteobacteria bacterium GM202ARS2]
MSSSGRVHIIGGGLAGLGAAVYLTQRGRDVTLYEGAPHFGGRCRSFYDKNLGMTIDNGSHLLLSGNHHTRDYLESIDATQELVIDGTSVFTFFDVAQQRFHSLRLNDGRVPWWMGRGFSDIRPRDYLALWRLFASRDKDRVADCFDVDTPLFRKLIEPLAVSVLNASADVASARLLWAMVRRTLLRGGRFCRACHPRTNLSSTFVAPAVRWLQQKGVRLLLSKRVRALAAQDGRIKGVCLADKTEPVDEEDAVIVAVPPDTAVGLVEGLAGRVPEGACAIVNVHFGVGLPPPPPNVRGRHKMIGLWGGVGHWIFVHRDHISVTVSAAPPALYADKAETAKRLWREVALTFSLDGARVPAYAFICEKKATFLQSPSNQRRRHGASTALGNLFLAGDWTDTGLPATIEGALASGQNAAHNVLKG